MEDMRQSYCLQLQLCMENSVKQSLWVHTSLLTTPTLEEGLPFVYFLEEDSQCLDMDRLNSEWLLGNFISLRTDKWHSDCPLIDIALQQLDSRPRTKDLLPNNSWLLARSCQIQISSPM